MERKAPGSERDRRRRRKANAKARGRAREARVARRTPASTPEKGLGIFQAAEPLAFFSKLGRRGPVAAGLGAAGILAFAGLSSLQKGRQQGDLKAEALGLAPGAERSAAAVAGDSANALGNQIALQQGSEEIASIQNRRIRGVSREQQAGRLFQEKMFLSRLARMKQVATTDPGLFKKLAALVVGSSRPETTSRTERIGPQPSVKDLVDSGLFDGGPL